MTQQMTITTTAPAPAVAAPAQAPAPAPAPAAPAQAPAAPPNISQGAAPPAAAPAVAASSEPAKPGGEVTFDPTGDAGLDMALGFVGRLGIGPQDPALIAAEGGDFAMLKAKLALMGDKAKGWEQIVALGEQGLKTLQAKHQEAVQKTTDAILSVFGEDKTVAAQQWGKVREWAAKTAEPHEREQVNAALAAGGIAAKAMAAYLDGLYRKHPGAEINPAQVTAMATNTASAGYALTPAQYKAEVQALRGKLGNGMEGSPEYRALQARRLAYRA